jgi:hypothetical protein
MGSIRDSQLHQTGAQAVPRHGGSDTARAACTQLSLHRTFSGIDGRAGFEGNETCTMPRPLLNIQVVHVALGSVGTAIQRACILDVEYMKLRR